MVFYMVVCFYSTTSLHILYLELLRKAVQLNWLFFLSLPDPNTCPTYSYTDCKSITQ